MDISARIINLRKNRNISQYRLAKLAGVSQAALSDIESGKKRASLETIERICAALGLTLSEFFSDQPPDLPPEVRRVCDKFQRLTPDKLKILESVLDTWVD